MEDLTFEDIKVNVTKYESFNLERQEYNERIGSTGTTGSNLPLTPEQEQKRKEAREKYERENLEAVRVYLTCPNRSKYEELVTRLEKIKEDGDQIKIKKSENRYEHTNRLGLKPEYQEQVKEIEESNNLIIEKHKSLMEQLKQLGCDVYDDDSYSDYDGQLDYKIEPPIKSISKEWYNWEVIVTETFNVELYCHVNTKMYKFLVDSKVVTTQ